MGLMSKQERLNVFLGDLSEFVEKYYSSNIDSVEKVALDDWVKVIVTGPEESSFELWTEGEEITLIFSESHWHINDYNEPCDFENIYENTIESVLEILCGKLGTYSCWCNGKEKGGGSFLAASKADVAKERKEFFKGCNEIRYKIWGESSFVEQV